MYTKELNSIHNKILEQLSTLSFDSVPICANFILTENQLNTAINNKESINTDLNCQIDTNNNIIKNNNILSRVPILPQKNTNIYELVLKKLQKYKIIKMKIWISGSNIDNKTRNINITYIDIYNKFYKNSFSDCGYSQNYHYMPLSSDIELGLLTSLNAYTEPKIYYEMIDRLYNYTIPNYYYYPYGPNISIPISGAYFYVPINW